MKRSTKLWIALGAALVLVQVLYIVGTLIWFKPYVVTAEEGMEPGLRAGDYIYVRSTKKIERGDVITYSRPGQNVAYVKRVMALADDTIELRDRRLILNGDELVEPYVLRDDEPVKNYGPLRVPPGHFFALGDNRAASRDSRDEGPIAMDRVIGRVVYVFSFFNGPSRPVRARPRTARARPRE